MALLFMDGFDAGDYAVKYDGTGKLTASSVTRFGYGYSGLLSSSSSYAPYANKYFSGSQTIWIGFAYKGNNSDDYFLSTYGDGGVTNHINIRHINATTVGIFRGATELGRAENAGYSVWRYYELGAYISDVGGWAKLYVDGVEVISYSGDTKNGGTNSSIDMLKLWNYNYGSAGYFDDLYVDNADRHGDVRVQTLVPNAAGANTDFTPTGGTNYANVADIPDDTGTYNTSSTVGHKDTYDFSDLASGTGTVFGIQTNMHAKKADAGQGALKEIITTGGTTYDGNTTQLPTSTAWIGQVRETNPDTSAAWTVSDVNSLEAGAEVA